MVDKGGLVRKIVSIHVPKAAGSSFRNIINTMFGPGKVAPLDISGKEFMEGP